jgi:hypothetical protein
MKSSREEVRRRKAKAQFSQMRYVATVLSQRRTMWAMDGMEFVTRQLETTFREAMTKVHTKLGGIAFATSPGPFFAKSLPEPSA